MTRLWVVRSGRDGVFEQFAMEENKAVIGWDKAGDLSALKDRDSIHDHVEKKYSDADSGTHGRLTRDLHLFANEIQKGDIVLMPLKGKKKGKVAIGSVEGEYSFEPDSKYIHVRPVRWNKKTEPRDSFKGLLDQRRSIFEIREDDAINYAQAFLENGKTEMKKRKIETATNLILYGPPGTGKTYRLNKLTEEYSAEIPNEKREKTREDWLRQEFKSSDPSWLTIIIGALYDFGRDATLTEISKHEYVRIRQPMTDSKNVRNAISTYLSDHADKNSEVVKETGEDRPPFVFDQHGNNKKWYLVSNWEEECRERGRERIVELAKKWKTGPNQKSPDEKLEGEPDHESHDQRFEFVTFHQAYSYEDFVEGIRPQQDEETGQVAYKVVPGVFKRICQKAKENPEHKYAIFIDEINRGNIASVFGELITLLETDKRVVYGSDRNVESGMTLTLPYSGERFGIPANLDVYGTMNTADRSIALLDTALRRRFQFEELMPDASVINGSSDNGRIEDGEGGTIDLRKLLEAINRRIRFLLGRDMTIGHSYLIDVRNFEDLRNVLYSRIIPLLQEYFYDDWHRIQLVLRDVGANREKREPQIIKHETLKEIEIIGYDHDDFEDSTEYRVADEDEISPTAIRKIYEERTSDD